MQVVRYPTVRVVEAEQVPDDVRAHLEAGAEQLRELGFVASHWIEISSIEVSQFADSYSFMLRHEALAAGASIGRREFTVPLSTEARFDVLGGRAHLRDGTTELAQFLCAQGCDLRLRWARPKR